MRNLLPLLVILFSPLANRPALADPNALWNIVGGRCVPDQERYQTPVPCLSVDLAAGFVVFKDRVGATQLLVMPTARITGIEDPAVLSPGAPAYFGFAWQSLNVVRALAGRDLRDDQLSLAVNSKFGRTQNQLHIHVDCLRADVVAALRAHAADLTGEWTEFPVPLAGHRYLARVAETLNRPGATPFDLIADGIQGARDHMAFMTILVTARAAAMDAPADFILLADEAHPPADFGAAEELQDHACALTREP